jgi:hypothetical protein
MPHTLGARQRPLSKQLYDQPLLVNKSANNDHCYAKVTLRSSRSMRAVFSVQPVPRSYKVSFIELELSMKRQSS